MLNANYMGRASALGKELYGDAGLKSRTAAKVVEAGSELHVAEDQPFATNWCQQKEASSRAKNALMVITKQFMQRIIGRTITRMCITAMTPTSAAVKKECQRSEHLHHPGECLQLSDKQWK